MRLSKSQLDKFIYCPRCFWLGQRYKLKQPDMISSKVWKGIERICTAHYEKHRALKTTPQNLIGHVPDGSIPYQADRIDMKGLRYWGKGLRFIVEAVEISTALDDMIQRNDGEKTVYNCLDYKSKSKATDEESTRSLYQNQADVYDLAMNVNGYPTDGKVYFDYWYPVGVSDAFADGSTTQIWGSLVIPLIADHERIKKIILAAAACVDGLIPDPSISCPVCNYIKEREEVFKHINKEPEVVNGQVA